MKFAFIGQEIPMLLPSLLADLYFSQKLDAEAVLAEKNEAMRDLMQRYGNAVCEKAGMGRVTVCTDRRETLRDADCVIAAVSHREFIDLGIEGLLKLYGEKQIKILIDVKGMFQIAELKKTDINWWRL